MPRGSTFLPKRCSLLEIAVSSAEKLVDAVKLEAIEEALVGRGEPGEESGFWPKSVLLRLQIGKATAPVLWKCEKNGLELDLIYKWQDSRRLN